MAFVALTNGRRVDITRYPTPKQTLGQYQLICQCCSQPMYIRHTIRVSAHFAHNPNTDRKCLYDHISESEEHREAKKYVSQTLSNESMYRGARIDYEVIIPEVGRIADVMVVFPNGEKEVHEIQLSAIGTETLRQRTEDYTGAGMDVIWWLGKNADTQTNRSWTFDNHGYIATVSFSLQQVRVL